MTVRATSRRSQIALCLILLWRDVRAQLVSIWPYVIASAMCAVVGLATSSVQRSFETESVLIAADPLLSVHVAVLSFIALSLGLRCATSLSWEREHRTLEVLLSGPVTVAAVVCSKLLAELVTFLALGLVYSVFIVAVRPLGVDQSVASATGSFWLLAFDILPMLALGLVISAVMNSVRAAVVAFILTTLVLGCIDGTAFWLNTQDANYMSLEALYARGVLDGLAEWLSWVSPVAYLVDMLKVAAGVAVVSPTKSLAALALLLLAIGASSVITSRKGPI